VAEQRMSIEGLIEELRRVAAENGPLGDLLPVVVQARDRNLRYKPWLDLQVQEIYTYETGEPAGKGGHTSYAALVIRAEYD
jgi:hypothetical protein